MSALNNAVNLRDTSAANLQVARVRYSKNGGAENRTRVQKPTPVESTCLAASPQPVLLRRVRRPRVSEASKTPLATSPEFSRPARLSTRARPAQLCYAPARFA